MLWYRYDQHYDDAMPNVVNTLCPMLFWWYDRCYDGTMTDIMVTLWYGDFMINSMTIQGFMI